MFSQTFGVLYSVNMTRFYFVGLGAAHTIAYSTNNGLNMTGFGKLIFTTQGNGIAESLTPAEDFSRRRRLLELYKNRKFIE